MSGAYLEVEKSYSLLEKISDRITLVVGTTGRLGGILVKALARHVTEEFRDRLNRPHQKLIHIEGGLGAQILSVIAFWDLLERLGPKKARVNLDYFASKSNSKLWKWELDKYGIVQEDFLEYSDPRWTDRFFMKHDYVEESELQSYWDKARQKFASKFPILEEEIRFKFEKNFEQRLDEEFTAIHLRRGDYLQVASRVVALEEYLLLLSSLNTIISSQVVILTDSIITQAEKSQILNFFAATNTQVFFLDSPELDVHLVHGIMRIASVLITSNSTFSFSAGLLSIRAKHIFSPARFHSDKNAIKQNASFLAAGNFFLWNPLYKDRKVIDYENK